MITRKDYLQNQELHRAYYAQFVTQEIITHLRIGLPEIITSTDTRNFNDIPLGRWNHVGCPGTTEIKNLMKERGDFFTQSGVTCILKEAARQLRESISK